jgi:hypothetical protein
LKMVKKIFLKSSSKIHHLASVSFYTAIQIKPN